MRAPAGRTMVETAPPIPSYDFLTLGETLLRLSPPGMQRLDQARNFEVGIGGSELNVASMLARLGRRTAWVSRLPRASTFPASPRRWGRAAGRWSATWRSSPPLPGSPCPTI